MHTYLYYESLQVFLDIELWKCGGRWDPREGENAFRE
jgi:hypothetical protein